MRKQKQYVLAIAMAAVAAITYSPVNASTTSDTFLVTITILATCSVDTTSANVGFGSQASTATDAAATGTISVTCTPGTSYTVELNNGENYSGTTRRMIKGADYVAYGLYQDSAHSTAWGTDPDWVSDTGDGSAQSHTVYGLVPSANFPAGDYTDTVTATVTY